MFELFVFLAALLLSAALVAYGVALAPHTRPQQPSVGQNKGDIEQVKCRAPGLSDHASPVRQTEARAKRTLERTPYKTSLRTGAGETLHLPSSRALGGKSGMTRAKPLVLKRKPLPTAGIQALDLSAWKARAKRIVTRRAKTNAFHRLAW